MTQTRKRKPQSNKSKSRLVREINHLEGLIVTKGNAHGFKEGDYFKLTATFDTQNEGTYLIKSKRGSRLTIDPQFNPLKASQPEKSTTKRTKLEEFQYKAIPSSPEEYEEIFKMVKMYVNCVRWKTNRLYCKKIPDNLRKMKDWNDFYKVYKFLEARSYKPYGYYIKIIFEEHSHTNPHAAYPTPNRLIAYEYLFLKRLRTGSIPKEQVVDFNPHLRKEIGRDVLTFCKMRADYQQIHGKTVTEQQIAYNFYTSFSNHFVLSNPVILNIIQNKLKTFEEMFPSRAESMRNTYKILLMDRKILQTVVEYKKRMYDYIDSAIEKHKVYYQSDPISVINYIRVELEDSDYAKIG